MTKKYLNPALVGKTIKSIKDEGGEIPEIHFTDGSHLEIFVDDTEELNINLWINDYAHKFDNLGLEDFVAELLQGKFKDLGDELEKTKAKIDALQSQVDNFIEVNNL